MSKSRLKNELNDFADGFNLGEKAGYTKGEKAGYTKGQNVAYNKGYNNGFLEGIDKGKRDFAMFYNGQWLTAEQYANKMLELKELENLENLENLNVIVIWDDLIYFELFTEEELKLITSINGFTVNTLNKAIMARYNYKDYKAMIDSDFFII